MEKVCIPVPAMLFISIYERFGEESTDAILDSLAKLVVSESPSFHSENSVYPRPGVGTITGKIWVIADNLSQNGIRASRKKVVDACIAQGINANTANTQYTHWRKAPLQSGGLMRS